MKINFQKIIKISAIFFVAGLLFFGNVNKAEAAVKTWTGTTSGAWSVGSNWGGTAPVTGDDLVFPNGASNLSNTNDLTENTIINSITFSGSGYTLSGNAIILGPGLAGITDSVASGGNTISLDIRLDATRDIVVTNTAESLTISGRIAGVGGINKEGTGTLILSGGNTYGGTTKINVGVINARHSTALGTIALGTEVVGGAALELQGNIDISYEALALRGWGVSGTGGALRNISDSNTFRGLITLSSAGGTEIASDSGTLTITGGTTGNAPLIFDGAGDMVFSTTPLAGSGAITKNGAGTVTYNFPNTNTGATTINAGTLLYGVDNATMTGAITVTGGTLDIATFSDMVGTVTLGTLDLASGTITGSTGVLSSGSFVVYEGTISAIIAGQAGTLAKSTRGTVVLTRPNLFTGATTVTAGILEIQDSLALGVIDGITTVSAGATLQINGDALSIPEYITFSGTGHLYTGAIRNRTGDNTLTGLLTLGTVPMIMSDTGTTLTIDEKGLSATTVGLTVGGEGNTTFTSTAPIYGTTATLTKNDTGTLTIQSVSNFTGATNVNRGTLLINYDGAITNSAVTVNAGGTYTVDNTEDSALNRMSESALTMNGGNFNYIGNSTKSTAESTGALTLSSGHNVITVTPGAGGSTTMTFASLSRTAGASVLFRGTNFGNNPGPNVSTLMFTTAPTAQILGAGGAEGTTTMSILKGAYGDGSLSGTGSDMVTVISNKLRLLTASEYASDLQTANANVKLTADSAAVATNTNSLILNGFGITNPGGAITIPISSASLAGNILINSANNIAGANTTLGITTFELNVLATANSTISAIIGTAVAGSLTVSGTGNVTMSAANLYTGLTSINGTTLTYGASNVLSSGGVTVVGGTLDIAGNSDTVGAVILQNGIITGSSGVLSGTSYSFREGTVSAILGGGSAAVTRVTTNAPANSVVTLTRDNTYTGATTISSGILKLGANGGGTNTPLGTTGGATTVASGAALDLNGYTLGTAEGLTINGLGFGPGTTVANGNSNMGALMNSGGTATYSGAIALGASARINADAGVLTISSAISGATFTLTIGGFSASTFSGVISTSLAVTKDGIGDVTLSNGNSSYTGATTVSVGTLKIGAVTGGAGNSALGTTVGITTVSTGARLDLNGFSLGIAEPLTINGVGYGLGDFASGALMNSSGSTVTFSGVLTITTATIKADFGQIDLTAATHVGTTVVTLGGSGIGTLSAALASGAASIVKIGTGTWTLSGQSQHTGAIAVNLGTLKLGATGGATNTPFGTNAGGVAVYSGAVLDFNTYTIPTTEALTINGRGIGNGGALIGSNGTFGGTVAQGTDSRITNASGTMTITGAVSGAFALYIGGAGNITLSAVLPAVALSVTKQGAGTLTVTGANLYTGITRVDAGSFTYASTGTTTLVGTNLTVNGGTFNNSNNADTIGTVTLIGGVITNSVALTATTSYTLESGTISGIIAGAIPVTKNTNNTVTMTGASTISSTVVINAGELTFSGSGTAVSVTAVTVNLGGTLTLDNSATNSTDRLGAITVTMNGGNFNYKGSSSTNASETISQLAYASGHNIVTVTPGAGGSTQLTMSNATCLNRSAGATVLYRGTSFGSAAAANVSTLLCTTPPTSTYMIGAGGGSGTTTISVLKGSFGDGSLTGTGTDMVTYNVGNSNGLRLLNGAGFSGEYAGDLQTANANVKLTADRAAVATNTNSLILNGFGITNPGGAITIPISSASLAGNILINSTDNIAGANTTLGITTTELDILATADSTISAIIGTATTGSLTLSGTGNVTMSAANPYTSTTFINGATLTYSASNVLSSGGVTMRGGLYNLNGNSDTIGALTLTAGTVTTGAGTITLGSDLTSIANGNYSSLVTGNLGLGANRIFNVGDGLMDNDLIISAVVSGGFTVTKSTGAGVLVFANSNTYTGATTVSAGILRLGTAGDGTNTPLGTTAAGTTVGTGAGLDLNGFTLGTAEGLTLNSVLATGALQNTSSTAVSYSGLIVLTASSFIISNYGDINITNTGNITGTGFTLTIGGSGNGSLASNLNTSTSGALTKSGAGLWTISGGASTFTGATTVSAGTLKLGSAGSGSNTPVGTSAGGISITSGGTFDLNGFTLPTAEALALNGTGIASTGGIGAFINTSNNALSYSGVITPGATSRLANYGSGLLTLTGNIVGSTRAITFVTVGDITQSSASVWSGTSTSLIKEGSGTLILAGQNSFTTGTVTVSTGVLRLGASGGATNTPLGTSAAGTTVALGAVLDLSTFNLGGASTYETLGISGTGIKLGGALISGAASGTTNFGATTITANSIVTNSAAGTIRFNSTVTAAAAINLWINGTGPTIIGGVYGSASTATLTKDGAGTLTISAVATNTGLVRINGGTLQYGIADALSTSAVTIAGGTWDLAGYSEGGTTLIGAVTLIDGAIVNTGGAASIISSATYTVENGTISAVLGGAVVAAIAKNTAGRVILSGDNTFNGTAATIAVNAGYLNLRHNNALGAAASANTTTVSGGATLELENSITIPSPKAFTVHGTGVAKAGAIRSVNGSNTISANITLGTTNVRINTDSGSLTIPSVSGNTFNAIFGGAGSTTVSGAIGTTSGSVTKDGAGTVSLPGNNTYTGPTTIILGTVVASSTGSIGNGSVTNTLIFSGGTLQATGTLTSPVNRAVTLAYGGGTIDTNNNSVSIAGTVGSVGGLTKTGLGTLTITGATTIGDDLTISAGTFVAPTTLTINGDFSNSGTFTHSNGTVTLVPTSSNLTANILGSSNTTFYNLTNTTAGSALKFKSGNTYTFANLFTLTGTEDNPIELSSDTPTEQWLMTLSGSSSISYIKVKDSGCSGGNNVGASSNILNYGNNGACWLFNSPTLYYGGFGVEASATPDGQNGGGSGGGSGGGNDGNSEGGGGTITEVGSGSQRATHPGPGGVQPLAFPGSVTAGNLLIVAGGHYSDGIPAPDISVDDTVGTTYTVLETPSTNGRAWIAYGIAAGSGANTVTVTTGSYTSFSIDEFSGVDATPLDVDGGDATGSSDTPSDDITTTVANALVIGSMTHLNGSPSITPGSGYTQIGENEDNASSQASAQEFKLAGAAGSYAVGWTLGSSSTFIMLTASFKPSGGGGQGGGDPGGDGGGDSG